MENTTVMQSMFQKPLLYKALFTRNIFLKKNSPLMFNLGVKE